MSDWILPAAGSVSLICWGCFMWGYRLGVKDASPSNLYRSQA